ncbi:MAG TPA: PEP-CTERM sorting domain-containing protein, partial [Phycisphaerae bacterium]|nr:PEP-CTERM sorting domain-containing protein [Phycisphaerae bacterium]
LTNNATIMNEGFFGIEASFVAVINNSGTLFNVGAGAQINNNGLIGNSGRIVNAAEIQNNGEVDNSGLINVTNIGQIDNNNLSILINSGTIANTGVVINNGRITNNNNGTFTDAGMVTGTGTYVQDDPAAFTKVTGTMSQAGVFINGGTLGLSGGKINTPDFSCTNCTINLADPGTSTINGSFTDDNGTIKIQIAGTGPGQYDVLDINGPASYTGMDALNFDFIDGFAPSAGDLFNFMTAEEIDLSGLTGPFDISFAGLAPGAEFTLDIDPVAGSFTLLADNNTTPAPEPGNIGLLIVGLVGTGIARRRWAKRVQRTVE